MKLRVAIVAADALFRAGLARLIEQDVRCEIVTDGERPALGAEPASADAADVAVIDGRLDDALARCERLRGTCTKPLLVSAPDDDAWGREALSAGAWGLLTRHASEAELVKAVLALGRGDLWAPRRLVWALWSKHVSHATNGPAAERTLRVSSLSERERDVLRLTAAGLCNKDVAARLAISEATVKVHLTHIFQKLRVRGRNELTAAYHGVVLES